MTEIVMTEQQIIKQNTWRTLLWIGIASMIMMFAGLTSAYIVRAAEGNWTHFELPTPFLISTILILISSITMQWAVYAVKRNQSSMLKTALLITLGLGFLFVLTQFLGWSDMVKQKLFLVAENPATSFVYILSGLHLVHLAGGLIFLIVVAVKAILDKYNSQDNLSVTQCAIYWHFLDVLWVYLFLFFNYVK